MNKNPTIIVDTQKNGLNVQITEDGDVAATALCLRRLSWVCSKIAGAYEGKYFNSLHEHETKQSQH